MQIIWLQDGVLGIWTTCVTKDISAGGLAFFSRAMVHCGSQRVMLLGLGAKKPVIRGFECLHCRYDSGIGQHIIGASWVAIPDNIQIKATLGDKGWKLEAMIQGSTRRNRKRTG